MRLAQTLRRELGLIGATMLGLGSILGTGVFVSIGLVAGIAGAWTPVAVCVAAGVATCNALSSAQLAAAYPRSGGTYEYGYELLHPLAGFTAGWMFLCAKSASAATAALGFAGYVMNTLGSPHSDATVWLAGASVAGMTVLVASGLRRSNVANTIIVTLTVLVLGAFIVAGGPKAFSSWRQWEGGGHPGTTALLEAIALMFVAYTGYGRVATLGEEVARPRQTIPKAIVSTLGVTALLYVGVAVVGVGAVGGEGFYQATQGKSAPLEIVSRTFGIKGLPELVALGAITAMLGVLLNLLLGLSRVLLAMGRRGDMPSLVTRIDTRRSTPYVAVASVGTIILALTLIGSIKLAWSFSAFTVLIYYALTNLAALRLRGEGRLYSRIWAVVGLTSCLFLAFWVKPVIWLVGLAVIGAGFGWYAAARRLRPRTQ